MIVPNIYLVLTNISDIVLNDVKIICKLFNYQNNSALCLLSSSSPFSDRETEAPKFRWFVQDHCLSQHLIPGWIMERAKEFQKNIYFCFIDYAKAFDYVDHNQLWKILKEMGIPDHLTCLLRNLYAGQEATVKTGHGTTDWFQIGKGVYQGCILSPCLFNFYAEYIMRNTGLEEA